jgi:DNA uptake protein ComE-like DNA-binding protein
MALTTGEKSALRWLVAVGALGSGAQLYRHWHHHDDATPLATEALSRQLVAVDSAQRAGRRHNSRTAAGVRRSRARPDARHVAESAIDAGDRATQSSPSRRKSTVERPTLDPVDVDVSDAATLERLPRIGPALAARIIAERAARGPYGSLKGLERVRGIGPKLAQLVGPLVTFSGTPRPSSVQR